MCFQEFVQLFEAQENRFGVKYIFKGGLKNRKAKFISPDVDIYLKCAILIPLFLIVSNKIARLHNVSYHGMSSYF